MAQNRSVDRRQSTIDNLVRSVSSLSTQGGKPGVSEQYATLGHTSDVQNTTQMVALEEAPARGRSREPTSKEVDAQLDSTGGVPRRLSISQKPGLQTINELKSLKTTNIRGDGKGHLEQLDERKLLCHPSLRASADLFPGYYVRKDSTQFFTVGRVGVFSSSPI